MKKSLFIAGLVLMGSWFTSSDALADFKQVNKTADGKTRIVLAPSKELGGMTHAESQARRAKKQASGDAQKRTASAVPSSKEKASRDAAREKTRVKRQAQWREAGYKVGTTPNTNQLAKRQNFTPKASRTMVRSPNGNKATGRAGVVTSPSGAAAAGHGMVTNAQGQAALGGGAGIVTPNVAAGGVHGAVADGQGNVAGGSAGAVQTRGGIRGVRAGNFVKGADGSVSQQGGGTVSGQNGTVSSTGSVNTTGTGDVYGGRDTTAVGAQGNSYQGSTSFDAGNGASHSSTCYNAYGVQVECKP